jgi:Na+/melibiose symporter-like transporter
LAYPEPSADSNAFCVVIVVVVVVAVVLLLLLFFATRRVLPTVHRDPPIEVIQEGKSNQGASTSHWTSEDRILSLCMLHLLSLWLQ